jgi:hypothetical protein
MFRSFSDIPADPAAQTAADKVASVIERAALSPSYRARLKADPHAVLAEAGIDVARTTAIVIHELPGGNYAEQAARIVAQGQPSVLHLPIPVRPRPTLDEIDDADMGRIVGGAGAVPNAAIFAVSQQIAGLLGKGAGGNPVLAQAS